MSVEFRQDCRFGVQSYCVRKEQQGPLRLRPASATVSLRNLQLETEPSVSNFLIPPKFGYPGLAAGFTLALSSLPAAVVHLHEKRPALPGKLKRASQKGKK